MPQVIDLRSDTVTRPTPGMRQTMASAVVGDDVFEDDPTVKQLEVRVAQLFAKEAALFVASGTMGNQVCLKTWTSPGDEVILDVESHIACYEVGTAAAFSGLQLRMIECPGGIMQPETVRDAVRADDIHQPRTRVVCLENTHNRGGGIIIPLEQMQAVAELAHERGLLVHLDGARIWNASAATGIGLAEYGRVADSLMCCFSKGLGAPVGSMIVGSKEFITRARRTRKMFGGGMRQVGILAAAGLYALEHHLPRLKDDHEKAAQFAESIRKIPGVRLIPDPPPTNIVVFDIANTGKMVGDVVAKLKERSVLMVPFGRTRIRAVAHLDVSTEDMQIADTALREVVTSS